MLMGLLQPLRLKQVVQLQLWPQKFPNVGYTQSYQKAVQDTCLLYYPYRLLLRVYCLRLQWQVGFSVPTNTRCVTSMVRL